LTEPSTTDHHFAHVHTYTHYVHRNSAKRCICGGTGNKFQVDFEYFIDGQIAIS